MINSTQVRNFVSATERIHIHWIRELANSFNLSPDPLGHPATNQRNFNKITPPPANSQARPNHRHHGTQTGFVVYNDDAGHAADERMDAPYELFGLRDGPFGGLPSWELTGANDTRWSLAGPLREPSVLLRPRRQGRLSDRVPYVVQRSRYVAGRPAGGVSF